MDNDEVEEQGRGSKRRGRERKWREKRERREDKNILMDSLLSPMTGCGHQLPAASPYHWVPRNNLRSGHSQAEGSHLTLRRRSWKSKR